MKVALVASPCAPHQINCCNALEEGFAWHGIPTVRVAHSSLAQTDIVACWGWRNAKQHHDAGRRVLVMERGYIGDRTAWTSLGWNGLNGRATFPEVDDGGGRFMRHFHEAFQPENPDGDYVLLIGQVPGDASIEGRDMERWYVQQARDASELYGLPVHFRPHPVAVLRGQQRSVPRTVTSEQSLADDLAGAAVVVTFNSNTGVDAVLAGKTTVTMDAGAMAWPVTDHVLGQHGEYDREPWAYRMAWKQWRDEEISNGDAIARLLEAMPHG